MTIEEMETPRRMAPNRKALAALIVGALFVCGLALISPVAAALAAACLWAFGGLLVGAFAMVAAAAVNGLVFFGVLAAAAKVWGFFCTPEVVKPTRQCQKNCGHPACKNGCIV